MPHTYAGEEVTEYVTVTNDGALGTGYSLFDPDAWTPRGDDESIGSQDGQGIVQASATKLTDEEQILQDIYAATPNDRRVLRFEKAGIVSGYKSVRVPITFRPCVLGKWTGTIHINFADAGTPDISIALSAVVTQEPIYLKKPVVDFQTVLYDHVYRDSLIVYNRGKTAMKCELRLPEEAAGLRKSLEFLPPLGFPQNDGFFAFQLKFRPEPNMWNQISDAYGDPETGCIEFPMLVTVPDQSLPVRWTFKAQISPGDLVFEPKILDFGVCSCNEAVAMDVKVINTSALPQEVGFVRLKPEVSVQPNDGFLSLLPKETTVVQVLFAPRSAVDYQFGLICKTITGKQCRPNPTLTVQKEYEIPCRGTGLFPAVEVSCSVLKMAAVAEGGRTSESIVLSNSGKEVQQFECTPQPESNVSVTPAHGRLQPGEKRRLTVEFRAHAAAQSVQSDTPLDAGSAQPTDTEWSEHRRWLVPCFFRVEPEEGKRIRVEHLNVEVHTTTIRPIVADEDGLVYRELDFGQVPLGPGKVVKFMLNNKGATEAKMSCSALDPNGAFIMLSGSRPIPATGKVQVVMCFDPPEVGSFEQSVRIQTSANEYTVVCKGEGVRPKLRIEPDLTSAGTRRGSLHVGDAVCSRAVGKTLRLCNETQQPMSWSAHITDLRRRNSNGLEPFFVVPPRGTIDGGGEVDVEVRFCPDHQSTGFGGLLTFDVPSQNEAHQVELMGRGWHQGAFVVGGDEEAAEARADAMAHVLPDLFDSLGNGGTEPKRMTLTLRYDTVLPPELSEGEEGGAPLACGLITAGNAGDAAEKGGAADIAFDALPPDTGFAMRVAGKLAFGPQEVAKVGFVFTPPSLEQLRQADDPKKKEAAALLELGIGFWQEATVMCTLKGGAPAPEGGSASVALKLRAYVDAA